MENNKWLRQWKYLNSIVIKTIDYWIGSLPKTTFAGGFQFSIPRDTARGVILKSYRDEDWLREQYVTCRKSTIQISNDVGCDPSTINYWLKRFNIPRRTNGEAIRGRRASEDTKAKYRADPKRHKEDYVISKEFLVTQYLEFDKNTYEIAEIVGCKASCIQRRLRKYGIRKKHGPRKGHCSDKTRQVRSENAKNNPKFVKYPRSGSNNPMWGRRGSNSPQWKGGISFEPYCHKFNHALKEEIRERFGHKCYLCTKTEKENGNKLHTHHCDYNKGQGCGSRWSLLPLCNSCHGKTGANRHYYFNLLANYWAMNLDINFFDDKHDFCDLCYLYRCGYIFL